MKVLLNCHIPCSLTHGGTQIQIKRTKAALDELGVENEWLRWWDETQQGDVLHHFCAIPSSLIELGRNKGWKVANTILMTETCNRANWELLMRKLLIRTALNAPLPRALQSQLPWRSYLLCDQMIVGLGAERRVLEEVYGVEHKRVAVLPLGISERFLEAKPGSRSEAHLITQGTISPVKRSLELARLAREAEVPVLFVGKPFDLNSNYWKEFSRLIDNKYVKHHPHVGGEADLIELLRRARGYVLLSRFENWCLAAHEAAACGLPLLVPDQPWSRERFGNEAKYWPKLAGSQAVEALREFHQQAASLPSPQVRQYSWVEVGKMLRDCYAKLLASTSR